MRGFEFSLGSDSNFLYERQKFKTIGAAKDYVSKKMFKLDHESFRPSVQSLVPMKYAINKQKANTNCINEKTRHEMFV